MNNAASNEDYTHAIVHHTPVKKAPEMNARERKIQRLKDKIAAGKYRVSNSELAKALILSL